MGYYTQYKLESVDPPEMYQTIKDELSLLAYPCPDGKGPDVNGRAVSPWIDDDRWGNCDPGCKWYSYFRDAQAISEKYPDVTFTIAGLGEDDDEWWRIGWPGGIDE